MYLILVIVICFDVPVANEDCLHELSALFFDSNCFLLSFALEALRVPVLEPQVEVADLHNDLKLP